MNSKVKINQQDDRVTRNRIGLWVFATKSVVNGNWTINKVFYLSNIIEGEQVTIKGKDNEFN